MKVISQIKPLLFKHSNLVIVGLIAYIVSLSVLKFAYSAPMLLLGIVSPFALVFILTHSKQFIYFTIFYWPFAFVINKFFSFVPGGNQYYQVNMLGVISVLTTILGLAIMFIEKVQIFKYKLTFPMLLFLGSIVIGVLLSPLFFYAFRWIFRYGMHIVFYFLIVKLFDIKGARKLLKYLSLGFIPVILYSFWIFFTQRTQLAIYEAFEYSGEAIYRLGMGSGGFHPNAIALYLSMFIVFYLFLFFESRKIYKWVYVPLIISMIFLLFHTYSRMGWICFLAGMTVIGLLRYRRFLFISFLIGTLVLMLSPTVTEHIKLRLEERGAIESRFRGYEFAWDLFLQKPIFGHGQGSFMVLSGSTLEPGIREKLQYGVGGTMAHNEYIRILAENGISGLAIFLFYMYRLLVLAIQVFKSSHSTTKNYGAFLISLLLISLLSGIPGDGYQATGFYLCFFFGIGEIFLRELQSPQPAQIS